jgi:two-component system, chemotaxis family, sensor kinase CheA
MDDLLSEFLTETAESLETVDIELVRFEADPTDKATLNNIFRLVHTIKGTCGFIGLPRLEAVAHAGETLLGRFRDGRLDVTPPAVTLVLASIDQIKEILSHLEASGVEPDGDDSALIARLEAAAEGDFGEGATQATAKAPVKPELKAEPEPKPEPKPVAPVANDTVPPPPDGDANARWDADQGRYLRPGEVSLADLEAAFHSTAVESEDAYPSAMDEAEAVEPVQVAHVVPAGTVAATPAPRPGVIPANVLADPDEGGRRGEGGLANQSIRVSVDVLEDLMTMVSELVLTRNQLMQMVRHLDDSEFKIPLQRLSNITSELQDGVMKTRMQPISNAWKKLPRIVRDACNDMGKKIDLVMEGEQTELDRQVLELIKDPLTHMIRNSCDHGVETPDVRISAGKPANGTIKLHAYHEGGHIIIEVSDDGAGLKVDRLRAKALEKGVISPEEAMTLSDAQVQRLIFHPGFSTAAKVTNLSGRGVGMDVVKTNIELIGGAIDLKSREGEGTTFLIKIPLTLAIISSLIVGSRGQRYALPQLSVVELVRAGPGCEHAVETIKSNQVLRLRDRLLPLVSLQSVLGEAERAHEGPAEGDNPGGSQTRFVVVMQVGEQRFGVIVEEVFDTEEIVVKPLMPMLSGIGIFSGATILGDGSVILILDPNGVAKTFVGEQGRELDAEAQTDLDKALATDDRIGLLLFRAGGTEPKACPLSLITRLEDLDASSFERTQSGIVVQYRGQLMPVIHAAGAHMLKSEGQQPVLVFNQGRHVIGIAVDEILDIVNERLAIQLADDAPNLLGTAVLKGKATEVVDVAYYLAQAEPDWDEPETPLTATRAAPRHVLLLETAPFFRNLLQPLLQAAGYRVTSVEDVETALAIRERGERFDAFLMDVDNTAAAERFIETLSADPLWKDLPHLALSSRPAVRSADFASCVRKSDRQAVLSALETAFVRQGEAA